MLKPELGQYFLSHLAVKLCEKANNYSLPEIILVKYPLAPDFKYPCQLNHVLDVYQNLECVNDKNDDRELVLIGDSAGGNLAVSLLFALQKRPELKKPNQVLLISPWLDLRMENEYNLANFPGNGNCDMLSREWIRQCALGYVSNPKDFKVFTVSPLEAARHDPKLIRQVFTQTRLIATYGGIELFAKDIIEFAALVRKAGCSVSVDVDEKMIHDYQIIAHVLGARAMDGISRLASILYQNT